MLGEQRREGVNLPEPIQFLLDEPAAFARQSLLFPGMLSEAAQQSAQPIGKIERSRSVRDQKRIDAPQDLRQGPYRGAENRRTGGKRLYRDEAEAFKLQGRHHDQIGALIIPAKLIFGHKPQQPHTIGEASLHDPFAQS